MSKRRAEQRHPELHKVDPPTRDVAIGYCRSTNLDGIFAERLMDVQDYDWLHNHRIRKRIFIESGPRIAAARNRVVERWLEDPESQWLWMLDTDMTFTADTLDRLLEAADPVERPIVGGLCFAGGRDFRIAPTIYVANPDAPPGELNLQLHFDYPADSLIRVHATGAACLLIHRSVGEKLYARYHEKTVHPWFAETEMGGKDIGEDVTFCIRAGLEGFPIYVHTGIKIGHRKTTTLTEDEYLANRAHIDSVGEDEARTAALKKIGIA